MSFPQEADMPTIRSLTGAELTYSMVYMCTLNSGDHRGPALYRIPPLLKHKFNHVRRPREPTKSRDCKLSAGNP